jgi:hypothetical protein
VDVAIEDEPVPEETGTAVTSISVRQPRWMCFWANVPFWNTLRFSMAKVQELGVLVGPTRKAHRVVISHARTLGVILLMFSWLVLLASLGAPAGGWLTGY